MTDPDEVRSRLKAAGARLQEADAARQAALEDIGAALRDGRGQVDVKEMAKLAGVTRVTAYRLLDKEG